jgi:PIN domain nuclease of toxin-antitoxin system
VNRIVLDASAVLAMILNESGGERVYKLLDALDSGSDAEVFISSVNWCEILTRMQRENLLLYGDDLSALLAGVELVPFGRTDAEVTAAYAHVSRALSLGDRACLALAKSKQATAWTTERLWSQCQVDVPVELMRG